MSFNNTWTNSLCLVQQPLFQDNMGNIKKLNHYGF